MIVYYFSTVLTIGFQQPVYTANEGDGVVEVCVVLIDPANIPSGFFACGTLGTAPGSAECEPIHQLLVNNVECPMCLTVGQSAYTSVLM